MENFRTYKINPIKRLGNGAFGYVEKIELYGAKDYFCGHFARKVLSPSADILASVTEDELKRRFIREALYQSRCVHENVIYVYLLNSAAKNPYFVMELGEVDLLSQIQEKILTENEKISISRMLLRGVKKIHDKEYLHRDIKPHNIIRFSNGVYKISDFGLVKSNDASRDTTALTAIGQRMGTHRYMAPEVLYDAEYSKQTDIFALGRVMEDLAIQNGDYCSIIKRCLCAEKNERYSTIDDVIAEFDSVEFGISV